MSSDISRGPWGIVVPLNDRLYRIRLHNPNGGLMINTYLYRDNSIVLVIDPGWPWTLDAFETALASVDLVLADVDAWLYTHSHIDHMGLAAILQERSVAPHYCAESLKPHLSDWHAFIDRVSNWLPWAETAFATESVVKSFAEDLQERRSTKQFMEQVYGPAAVTDANLLSIGDTVDFGELSLQVHDAAGHDPTHLAFYAPHEKWLFAGDALLSTPTPLSRAMDDNLATYRQTLTRLAQLDVSMLMPGHGMHRVDPFPDSIHRAVAHLDDYHDRLTAFLSDEPKGVWEVAHGIRPTAKMGRSQLAVHLALTDSHLVEMSNLGLAKAVDGPRYTQP